MALDWLKPKPKKFILPLIIIIFLIIVTVNNYVTINKLTSVIIENSFEHDNISEKKFHNYVNFILYSNKFFEAIYPFHISPSLVIPEGNNLEYTYLNSENYNKVRELNEKLNRIKLESGNNSVRGAILSMFSQEKQRSPLFPIIIEAIILGLIAYVINSLIFIKKEKSTA